MLASCVRLGHIHQAPLRFASIVVLARIVMPLPLFALPALASPTQLRQAVQLAQLAVYALLLACSTASVEAAAMALALGVVDNPRKGGIWAVSVKRGINSFIHKCAHTRALPKCPLSSNFHLFLNLSKPLSQNILISRRKLSQAQALILNKA